LTNRDRLIEGLAWVLGLKMDVGGPRRSLRARKGVFLDAPVSVEIRLGGFGRCLPESECDIGRVVVGVQQRHGGCVPHSVWGDVPGARVAQGLFAVATCANASRHQMRRTRRATSGGALPLDLVGRPD
jgi:hypothetical protein